MFHAKWIAVNVQLIQLKSLPLVQNRETRGFVVYLFLVVWLMIRNDPDQHFILLTELTDFFTLQKATLTSHK